MNYKEGFQLRWFKIKGIVVALLILIFFFSPSTKMKPPKDNQKKGRIVRPTAKEMAIEMFDKRWPRINGITKTELVNLRYGNYYQQLLPFFEVFGRERFIFLDGTNMGMIFHLGSRLGC